MDQIRVGVVGCGYIGFRHAEIYQSIDNVTLVSVCDMDAERVEDAASRLDVKAFTRVEDMANEADLDAINVVTSASHCEPAIVAAMAGKHVLVETPFAPTLEECDRMIAAAEESGVNMMYVGSHRFYPHNVKAKELVDRGEVGQVIWITRDFNSVGVPGDTRWARWKSNGGGFFMRSGSILIDQLRWLAGSDVEEVYSVGMGRYVAGGDGEDNGMATFKFKNGVFASLVGSVAHPGVKDSKWRLGGTEGIIEFDENSGLRLGRGDWQSVPYPFEDDPTPGGFSNVVHADGYWGFRAEFEEFLSSIREGRQPTVTAYDGRACTEAAIAVVKSQETGAPVRLPL